jgi:hypothetical protein
MQSLQPLWPAEIQPLWADERHPIALLDIVLAVGEELEGAPRDRLAGILINSSVGSVDSVGGISISSSGELVFSTFVLISCLPISYGMSHFPHFQGFA